MLDQGDVIVNGQLREAFPGLPGVGQRRQILAGGRWTADTANKGDESGSGLGTRGTRGGKGTGRTELALQGGTRCNGPSFVESSLTADRAELVTVLLMKLQAPLE